jgi:hypothetical protein
MTPDMPGERKGWEIEGSCDVSAHGGEKAYPSGTRKRLWVWEGNMMKRRGWVVV